MHQALQHTRKSKSNDFSDLRQINFYNLNTLEDCYGVFKLPVNTSEKKLKEKYIKLCNYYHPRRGINWKTEHFIKVVLAYQFIEKLIQKRKKQRNFDAEIFFEQWKQQDMMHDLDRAFAYSKMKKEMFERLLYPRFYRLRSIIVSIFAIFMFFILWTIANEYWEGRASVYSAIFFPLMLYPVVRNILQTKKSENVFKKKLAEIKKL